MSLVPNAYLGLWEGTIDNKASSVVNATNGLNEVEINGSIIILGEPVFLVPPLSSELLPRVVTIQLESQIPSFYGVCVGGDAGGIYPRAGDGFLPPITPDFIVAATTPGQGVRVCTQGRCLARMVAIASEINIGDPLTVGSISSAFRLATSDELVFARALQFVAQKTNAFRESFAAIDIQREGILP